MKYLFFIPALAAFTAAAQQPASIIAATPVTKLPVYTRVQIPGQYSMAIANPYGKPVITGVDSLVNLDSMQVLAADLVFTDHPGYDNLEKLNTARLEQLFARFPQLRQPGIEWRLVRQMNGADKAAAQNLFHGFVVYYRTLQHPATAAADSAKLTALLTPREVTVRKRRRGFLVSDTSRLREMYEIEEYTIVRKMPVPEALAWLDMDAKEKRKYPGVDSILVFEKPETDSMETRLQRDPPEDSTVLKVLNRMPWQRMLVVADVTASMYPYTGQLLLWLKLHEDERPIHRFVFFNDGDNREEDQKPVGSTGGIYSTGSAIFEEVEMLLYKTMHKGSGGAIPENNIEALIRGMEACPECRDAVLIADNWSPVRDMELLPLLKKPVHIIVCGSRGSIGADYLTIARATGGTVHLAEQDISDLATLREGETLTIGEKKYQIENGRFRQLKK